MLTKETVVILAACAIQVAMSGQSQWGKKARRAALKIHNNYRRKEGGCRVNRLQYDMGLEAQAKRWAQRCVFKHELIKGRGENLAFSTYQNPEIEMIKSSSKGWFDEKKDYRPGQRGCQMSCHYTQLVWHSTEKVGCYSHRCPYLGGTTARNAWYFVCFYTPMGNWVGEEPYQKSCATPCHPGQRKRGGLCVGKAKVPCKNKNASCDAWAKRGECSKNPNYMHENCKKACKKC
ncbi:hypothetical protein RRG08_022170 [Elysia crispata]|uniref:ShKT domain-containing protein n=1 Tax=Elysia crispata TaxID=231223 RepID=A0AAE1DYX7_9GAST|nr:hypothetical protein RRG08_022170 [Elysia crispata]